MGTTRRRDIDTSRGVHPRWTDASVRLPLRVPGVRPSAMRAVAIASFAVFFGSGIEFEVSAKEPETNSNEQLARAWKSYYDFDCDAAGKSAGLLLKSSDASLRLHGQHIQARASWAIGDPALKKQAQAIWTRLTQAGQQTNPSAALRLATARLIVANDAAAPQSATSLEELLQEPPSDVASVEAWIELANFHAGVGRQDEAVGALDAADNFITELLGSSEEGDPLWGVFRQAIKAARDRIHDPGRLEFDRAIGLMKAKRYEAARNQFALVIERFPRTDYSPRSELAIGDCWLSQGRADRAEQMWSEFVTIMPAGPWRGQAFVRLMDISLAENLDLPAAEQYSSQATAALASMNAQSITSPGGWTEVAYDLAFRQGIVAYCGRNHPAAAEMFEKACSTATDKSAAERLGALISLARGDQELIPDDCQSASSSKATGPAKQNTDADRVPLALSLGVIHHLAGLPDVAAAYFGRVTGTPAIPAARSATPRQAIKSLPGATPAQVAFAHFCKGAMLQSRSNFGEARSAFSASLAASNGCSWHDETLYRLATVVKDAASAKLAKKSKSEANPGWPAESDVAAKAEQNRLASEAKAQKEAIGYYQELMTRYPKSRLAERASYMAGRLQIGIGEWSQGLATLDRVVKAYPTGPCTGESLLILGQQSLEQRVDVDDARTHLSHLNEWITSARSAASPAQIRWLLPFPPRPVPPQQPRRRNADGSETVRLSGSMVAERRDYDAEELLKPQLPKGYLDSLEVQCAKLLGFICFAGGEKEQALAHYQRITDLGPGAMRTEAAVDWSDYGRLKWGLDHGYLYALPHDLERYDARQRLAVLLADFYFVTRRFDDAATMARRLLNADFGALRGSAREYPQYLIATCTYWTRGREAAFPEYLVAAGINASTRRLAFASLTLERAAYAAGNITLEMRDPLVRERGREILQALAFSGKHTQYSLRARITYAVSLVQDGDPDGGLQLLDNFPDDDAVMREIAAWYAKSIRGARANGVPLYSQSSKGVAATGVTK